MPEMKGPKGEMGERGDFGDPGPAGLTVIFIFFSLLRNFRFLKLIQSNKNFYFSRATKGKRVKEVYKD